MNSFNRALRNKKRFGCLLMAFDSLYGKDDVSDAIIDGIMRTIEIYDTKDMRSVAEEFANISDLSVVADVAEDNTLDTKHFEVNKHFAIAMNTRNTVGVLFGEDFSIAVLGYDIKHELYVVKFDTIEDAPIDLVTYPQEGPNVFLASAADLASYNFISSVVFMKKPKDDYISSGIQQF